MCSVSLRCESIRRVKKKTRILPLAYKGDSHLESLELSGEQYFVFYLSIKNAGMNNSFVNEMKNLVPSVDFVRKIGKVFFFFT